MMFSGRKLSFKKNSVYPGSLTEDSAQALAQRKTSLFLADVMAELVCEKKDGRWELYLTHVEGSKAEKVLGKIYAWDEKIDISQLIPAEKLEHHQRLVESILNQGPSHLSPDWNLFLNSMYDRPPVMIQNPVHQTFHSVNIRLHFHEEKAYEIGKLYYFHVLMIDRNQEELCAIVMSNTSEHHQYLLHCISQITEKMPKSPELTAIQDIIQMGRHLASDDYRDFLPENLKATLCRKGGEIKETMTHWSLFCRLNQWIAQQNRLLKEAKLSTSLRFSPINPTRDFFVPKEKVQSMELLLLYMLNPNNGFRILKRLL